MTIDEMQKQWIEKYKKVIEQREEILTAFIAKYGCDHDKIVQIEWKKSPYETIWGIRNMTLHVCDTCKKLDPK